MIELFVSTSALKKAIRQILSGRGDYIDHDTVDISASGDSLEFTSTGTSTTIDAGIRQAGYARVPLPVLEKVKKFAGTFNKESLFLRVEPGRVRIESASVSHADVEMRSIGRRIADLPVNAGPLDVLALQRIFSAEEIADSGLAARVLDAQETARTSVDGAVANLERLEIPRSKVVEILEDQITQRALMLRDNLLRGD